MEFLRRVVDWLKWFTRMFRGKEAKKLVSKSTPINGNISCANQPLCANYRNFNLGHQINIQGEDAERWEGDLQKCDYPIQGRIQIVKITQSSVPLGCWSNDSDWSFHSLHRKVSLHLIRSHHLFLTILGPKDGQLTWPRRRPISAVESSAWTAQIGRSAAFLQKSPHT